MIKIILIGLILALLSWQMYLTVILIRKTMTYRPKLMLDIQPHRLIWDCRREGIDVVGMLNHMEQQFNAEDSTIGMEDFDRFRDEVMQLLDNK